MMPPSPKSSKNFSQKIPFANSSRTLTPFANTLQSPHDTHTEKPLRHLRLLTMVRPDVWRQEEGVGGRGGADVSQDRRGIEGAAQACGAACEASRVPSGLRALQGDGGAGAGANEESEEVMSTSTSSGRKSTREGKKPLKRELKREH